LTAEFSLFTLRCSPFRDRLCRPSAGGLISLDVCGVGPNGPRFQKPLKWPSDEFTPDSNPGLGGSLGGCWGSCYYYYLAHLAQIFDKLGVDFVTDHRGRVREWRAQITRALEQRQRKHGSWINDTPRFCEANLDVSTSWALMALSHRKPKGQ
jgi:hypothetical protein